MQLSKKEKSPAPNDPSPNKDKSLDYKELALPKR